MTTATRSVAVFAMRLPSTDRRALSQAWFSALHLAAPAPGNSKTAGAPKASLLAATRARPAAGSSASSPVVGGDARRVPSVGREQVAGGVRSDRRAPVSDLSRKMERAVLPHLKVPAPYPVTLSVSAAGGRVRLVVRTDGATTRIIALCAPQLRERVDRALAQARFALVATGARVEVQA